VTKGEFVSIGDRYYITTNKHTLEFPRLYCLSNANGVEVPINLDARIEGPHKIDAVFIPVDKNAPGLAGSKVYNLDSIFMGRVIPPPVVAGHVDVKRGEEWYHSPTSNFTRYNSEFSTMFYSAGTTHGDCGKAVIIDGQFAGIHCGTKNDGLHNVFLFYGEGFRSFFNFL
jgi:hypothetical protein